MKKLPEAMLFRKGTPIKTVPMKKPNGSLMEW
jgi:hypothetical protein